MEEIREETTLNNEDIENTETSEETKENDVQMVGMDIQMFLVLMQMALGFSS